MIYRFGDYELDDTQQVLDCAREPVAVEPMAMELLSWLVRNRTRLVTKSELFEVLWQGRPVTDAALSTCVKSARRAVGDCGSRQAVVRTVHGKGFRWVAPVDVVEPIAPAVRPAASVDLPAPPGEDATASRRPKLAILPFEHDGPDPVATTLAKAVPHDLIAAISRLRWLPVIARGSTFRFMSGGTDLDDVRLHLGARYCLTGAIEVTGPKMTFVVELSDTSDGAVVWAERFHGALDRVHEVRETIVAEVISAVDLQIPLREAGRARLRSPENMDAWSAYHLGLSSLYRFDRTENHRAVAMLERAVALEPAFARAHAALSFAHFKTAFMHYEKDRDAAAADARRAAETAIEIDPLDPFANFSMGRSLWLVGDLNGAQGWLNRSTSLSPSFAQGLYARAWTETLSGCSVTGRRLADESRMLSPLDPLLYAMLGVRAISFAIEGHDAEAARWSAKAANAPGAHDLIRVIAVFAHELAGDREAAAAWQRRIEATPGRISQAMFFRSFPFADARFRARISGALAVHGIL